MIKLKDDKITLVFKETGYDSCLTHGQYKLNS